MFNSEDMQILSCDEVQRQAQDHALGTSTVGCQVACLCSDMQSLQAHNTA